MADEDVDLKSAVVEEWDIDGMASDLDAETWSFTEPGRIDRRIFVASSRKIEELAKETVPEEELREAEEEETMGELLDEVGQEYLDALAEAVGEKMGEHVYGTFEEGDAFLGQYEEGDEGELREKFDVEDNPEDDDEDEDGD